MIYILPQLAAANFSIPISFSDMAKTLASPSSRDHSKINVPPSAIKVGLQCAHSLLSLTLYLGADLTKCRHEQA
jgi:hypothetical protein